jgi:effector-binding domain-containing protein
MIGEAKIEERSEQPYMGIRTQVHWSEFPKVIPECLSEVFGWLGKEGIAPVGPPFIRYHVINMEALMDVEMGVLVAEALAGNGRVQAGILPAGRYASLVYTGVQNGIPANGALLEWGASKGLVWDNWQVESGDAFGGRVEFFLTEPDDEPDPAKWETEVAIRLAD